MADWNRRITLALIVPYNLCVRGFQLWLYWQGLKALWTAGLEAWLLGLIFACVYFLIAEWIGGLMLPLPPDLEESPRKCNRG